MLKEVPISHWKSTSHDEEESCQKRKISPSLGLSVNQVSQDQEKNDDCRPWNLRLFSEPQCPYFWFNPSISPTAECWRWWWLFCLNRHHLREYSIFFSLIRITKKLLLECKSNLRCKFYLVFKSHVAKASYRRVCDVTSGRRHVYGPGPPANEFADQFHRGKAAGTQATPKSLYSLTPIFILTQTLNQF